MQKTGRVAGLVALQLAVAAAAPAATISNLVVMDSPFGGLTWDTELGGAVTAFVKDGATFLNGSDPAIAIDITTPGTYQLELRLNKGTMREMAAFQFRLFFDGAPSNGVAGIDVTAPRDVSGGTPGFTGDGSELLAGGLLVTLESVRISSFAAVDEVAEFSATPDGNIDYVGSFTLTVVPEPAGLGAFALLMWGALGWGRTSRRRR